MIFTILIFFVLLQQGNLERRGSYAVDLSEIELLDKDSKVLFFQSQLLQILCLSVSASLYSCLCLSFFALSLPRFFSLSLIVSVCLSLAFSFFLSFFLSFFISSLSPYLLFPCL